MAFAMIPEVLAAVGGEAAAGAIASEAATGAAAVEAGGAASRLGAFGKMAKGAGQTIGQNYKAGGTWDRDDDESAGSGAGAGGSATAPVASATTEDTVDYSGT